MEKKQPEKKVGKVLEILKKEYPFESTLLAVLGALVLVLGVYIFESRILVITLDHWWIFNTPLKIRIFSITIMLIGAAALVYAVLPFLSPSFKEMRKVSWPTRKTMINHSSRVFGFIIFLGLVFLAYDSIFTPLFRWLGSLSQ